MNLNGQSRRRRNVSFQTVVVGHSPIRRQQLAAEGAALFRPTLSEVTTSAITTSLKRNWWLISFYAVVEVGGAAVGAFLSGWGSLAFSLGIDVLSTVIGPYAVI
jgi:hypothetical protein